MTEVEAPPVLTGSAADIEDQWEFDAPRFRDFEQGTPPGESADDWFHTSATKGLATPTGMKPNTKGVSVTNEEYLEMSSQMDAENQSQQPQSQKTNVSSQPDPVEAEQVRAVLAHITNNTAAKQPVAGGTLVKKAPPKVETKAPKSSGKAPKVPEPVLPKKQQQAAPVPLKSEKAASPIAKVKTVPPAPAPAAAPSSSRPATRTMDKTTIRTTRSTAGGASAPTKARDPPRVRAPSTKVAAPAKKQPRPQEKRQQHQQQQRSKPQITVAKSPFLRSKQRSVTHRQTTKTTEQMELEKVEQGKKEAAALRRRNAQSVGPALQGRSLTATAATAGPSRPAPKRAPTDPVKEFNLRTAKRQRLHGMETRHNQNNNSTATASDSLAPSPWKSNAQRVVEFTTGVATRQTQRRPAPRGGRQQQQQQRGRAELTVPTTPRFATKTRARASRFKPTDEEEAEKAIAEAQALKVRQKRAAEMNRNPVIPAQPRRRSERRPLTEFKPFSFATDVRAAQRSTQPAAELPPPHFVFGADQENGHVTRSRAHVVTTTAAFASGSGARSSSRLNQKHSDQQQDVEYINEYDNVEDYEYQHQRPNSSGIATLKVGGTRRRTTAGPMLLGGAVRVLRNEQQQQQLEGEEEGEQRNVRGRHVDDTRDDDECYTEEQDGMQAIIRAGDTSGIDGKTTLHNPLFRA